MLPATRKRRLMPTLSSKGWISSPPEKLDHALAHFFESEETASYLYPDMIADVHTIIANNSHDMDGTAANLARTLEVYLMTLFDEAKVESMNVSSQKNDPSSLVTIKLTIKVRDKESVLERAKIVNYAFKKFKSITDASNFGIGIYD